MQTLQKKSLSTRRLYTLRRCAFSAIVVLTLLSSNLITQQALASNERLVELLHHNLENAGVDTSAVTFEELDGVVTLYGRVDSDNVRESVLDLVQRTHGVTDVVDELQTDF